jgi:hypothetical protein
MSGSLHDDGAGAQPCYVYGVVWGEGSGEFAARGLGGEQVYVLQYAELAALMSPSSPAGYPATRGNVVTHHLVLEEAMRAGAVLPMRFGIVAPSAQAVRDQVLRPRLAELQGLLARVAGKVELGLKVYWQEQVVFQEIVAENQELRALRDSLVGRPAQETKSGRIRLGQMVEADLWAKRERDASQILGVLGPLAHDMVIGKIGAEMMVLDATFLVSAERQGEFDQAVTKLNQELGRRLTFKYVGPLPPYSFVSITLEVQQ